MGLFSWLNRQVTRVQQVQYSQPYYYGTTVTWIDDKTEKFLQEGYSMNETIYSIAHITSEKIKVAPWNVYKVVDESSLKQMKALQKEGKPENHKRILDLKVKALELTSDSKLNELLRWPNEEETFSDLVAHSAISKMMTGNRFIRAIMLDDGANTGKPHELYLLPPQFINIINNGAYPLRTASYQLNCGTTIPFTKEEVMHDKYYNPLYDHQGGSHLFGMSPLKAARYRLTNDNSATEASTKSFQNMGPGGIVYVDDDRLTGEQTVEQASAVKKKWIEENTGKSNAKKITVSGYKMGFTEMGISPVDLAILEQQKYNLISFCNIWNFPHIMLLPDHATDNNVGHAERALTSRCALPLMTSFRDNFNRKLQTDWGYKGKNIYIDYDQSVYSELDVNRAEATQWIKESWWLTLRQRYELQNIEIPEAVDNDLLDKIYAPQGYGLLEDLSMPNLNEEI
jgi:HK97 family phage portal protein